MYRFFVIAAFLVIIGGILLHREKRTGPAQEGMSVGETLGEGETAGFLRADKPRKFRFPADHGPHPGFKTEWWYFTGNLKSSNGRNFGYQLTFFRNALTPTAVPRPSAWGAHEVYMAHFAVSDIDGKTFRFKERFSRAALQLAGAGGNPLVVHLEGWAASETSASPFGVRLLAQEGDMAIDLDLSSLTPEVLNGEGGLSRKGSQPGNASYYYSLPRMATKGSLRIGSETFHVSGLSWLDREWSTSALERGVAGWDWFSLQLHDGSCLMFYRLRKDDGSTDPFSAGTLVLADGTRLALGPDQVILKVTSWWTSPASGARYPGGWRLAVPSRSLDVEIIPRLSDQELGGNFRYWEGAVMVRPVSSASPAGYGYLEMTGYAERKNAGRK